jgi:hypothetical protein
MNGILPVLRDRPCSKKKRYDQRIISEDGKWLDGMATYIYTFKLNHFLYTDNFHRDVNCLYFQASQLSAQDFLKVCLFNLLYHSFCIHFLFNCLNNLIFYFKLLLFVL